MIGLFTKRKTVTPLADVKLPLTHIHTFKTGERLFTYKPEHYTEIAYRHYEQITELQRYIQTFGMVKSEWEVATKEAQELIKNSLEPKGDRTSALMELSKIFDHFKAKMENVKGTLEALNEATFCMFFLLEDEPPCTWSPSFNEKKLQLLKEEPEVRAFFFYQLQSFSANFTSTSAEDTALLLMELEVYRQSTALPLTSAGQAMSK